MSGVTDILDAAAATPDNQSTPQPAGQSVTDILDAAASNTPSMVAVGNASGYNSQGEPVLTVRPQNAPPISATAQPDINAQQAPVANVPGATQTAVDQALLVPTLGASVPITDAIGAGYALAGGAGDPSKGVAQNYSDLLAQAKQNSNQDLASEQANRPVESAVAQIGGGILGGAALGAAAEGTTVGNLLSASKAPQGAGLLGRAGNAATNIVKTGVVGAGSGAAFSGSTAPDAQKLEAATTGAATGLVVGPALHTAGTALGAGYKAVFPIGDKAVVRAFKSKAEKYFATQLLQRPDLKAALDKAETLSDAAKVFKIHVTTAEKLAYGHTDPLLAQQAVLAGHPATGGQMAEMYANRSGQVEKAYEGVAHALHPGGSYDAAAEDVIKTSGKKSAEITKELVAKSRPYYESAEKVNLDPKSDKILNDPLIKDIVDKMTKDPVYKGEMESGNFGPNSIKTLDLVQHRLTDLKDKALRDGEGNLARIYKDKRNELMDAMDAAAPDYATARSIYSTQPEKLAMRERLGSLSDIDPNNPKGVSSALMGGTQKSAQLAADALGPEGSKAAGAAVIRNAIETNKGDAETLVKKIAPNDRTSEQLDAYVGNQSKPLKDLNDLSRKILMGNRLAKGSPTAPLGQARDTLEEAHGLFADVAAQNHIGIAKRLVRMIGGSKENGPEYYKDMLDLVTTDRGMELANKVARLQQENAQRALKRLPSTAGAPGGAITNQLRKGSAR